MDRSDLRDYASFLLSFLKLVGGTLFIGITTYLGVEALAWVVNHYTTFHFDTKTPDLCQLYYGNVILNLIQSFVGALIFLVFLNLILVRRFNKEALFFTILGGASFSLVTGAVGSIVCIFKLSPETTMEIVIAATVVIGYMLFSAEPSNSAYVVFLLFCLAFIIGAHFFYKYL